VNYGVASAQANHVLQLEPLPAMPLVSVAVTNYNYGPYLEEVVGSLYKQTYGHWEAIIVDDGSTDNSASILAEIAGRDCRIRYFTQPNAGQGPALTSAISRCRGEIICLLDADDIFEPEKIEAVVSAFRAHPECGIALNYVRILSAGRFVQVLRCDGDGHAGYLRNQLTKRNPSPPCSGMSFRSAVLKSILPVPTEMRMGADAYVCDTCSYLTPTTIIPRPLSSWRIHGGNMAGARPALSHANAEWFRNRLEDTERIWRLRNQFCRERFGWTNERVCIRSILEYRMAIAILERDGERMRRCLGDLQYAFQHARGDYPYSRFAFWRALGALPPAISSSLFQMVFCGANRIGRPLALLREQARKLRLNPGKDSKAERPGFYVAPPATAPLLKLEKLPPMPLVSVAITNYNYGPFLEAAVESLRAQTYGNWEAVIVDDGSTDNSLSVLASLAEREPRLRYHAQANAGQAAALNAALSRCRGEIICLLDADDTFVPEKLQRIVETFRSKPDCGIALNYVRIVKNGRFVKVLKCEGEGYTEPVRNELTTLNVTPPCSGMCFRRRVVEEVLPIPAEVTMNADAYLCDVCSYVTLTAIVPHPLSSWRIHGNNNGGARPALTSVDIVWFRKRLAEREQVWNLRNEFSRRRFGWKDERVCFRGILECRMALALLEGDSEGMQRSLEDLTYAFRVARRDYPYLRFLFWQALGRLPAGVSKKIFEAVFVYVNRAGRLLASLRRAAPCKPLSVSSPAQGGARNAA
jgi:glycosyltransferase involved in cell wall biosynthesis